MDDSNTAGGIPTEIIGGPVTDMGSPNPGHDDHASSGAQSDDPHLRRIADYARDALGKANPLEAVLGATNSQLMRLAYRQSLALEEALSQGPADNEQLEHLTPAVDQFLKVTKQVGSFAGLVIRLAGKSDSKESMLAAIARAGLPRSEESGF